MKMKIEFESIEEYFEFMKFNTQPVVKKEDTVTVDFKNRIIELSEQILDLRKQVDNLQPVILEPEVKKPKTAPARTIRRYTAKTYNVFPKIQKLLPNGKFILGTGIESKYDMYGILKLKKHLPDLTLNYHDLGDMIGVSHSTAKILCCAIEFGFFDKWFEEWSKMQSKLPRTKNFIENNPEKRKALMGMG